MNGWRRAAHDRPPLLERPGTIARKYNIGLGFRPSPTRFFFFDLAAKNARIHPCQDWIRAFSAIEIFRGSAAKLASIQTLTR
jgi:hypothetical protein